MAKFYLAALQAVLLYGAADTWVVSQHAIKWLRTVVHGTSQGKIFGRMMTTNGYALLPQSFWSRQD
jgi:hypothetical protein